MELNGIIQGSGALTGSFDFDQADYTTLKNKPSINGVELVGNKTSEDLHIQSGGGTTDYNDLTNKPQINGVGLTGNKTANDLNLQEKITFPQDPTQYLDGEGNFTTPPYISSYLDLSDKPQINGVVLTGNKTGDDLDLSNKAHVNELSGALVEFQNGQDLPLIKCIVKIEPVQSGSGTPSPSNPRPITGWTDVTITVYNDDDTETYTAALGQTVYGGQLNVLTGELMVDRAMVDMGTLNWAFNGATYGMYEYGVSITDKANGATNMICSAFRVQASSAPYCIRGRSASNFVSVISDESTAEAFKTAVSGYQLVYELATPQTVQLTPQKVKSIQGDNNIEADTGEIDIIYINNVNDPAIEFLLNNL